MPFAAVVDTQPNCAAFVPSNHSCFVVVERDPWVETLTFLSAKRRAEARTSASAQTLDCSSTDSSLESSAAATERRKIGPQSDGRSHTPFVPEETFAFVPEETFAFVPEETFDVVVVAAAVAKSPNRFVFVVSVALSCHFSVVSRRASKPCPLTFALTPPRAN